MPNRHTVTAVITALILTACGTLRANEVLDRVIAVVEGEIILLSDLQQKMQGQLQQMNVGTMQEFMQYMENTEFQGQVLDGMIADELLVIKARRDSIDVTREEVDEKLDERLDQIRQLSGGAEGLDAELERMGVTLKEFKERMRDEMEKHLMREQVMMKIAQQQQVTRKDIETFYTEHKSELPAVPESVHVAHILVSVAPDTAAPLETLSVVQKLLEDGAEFAELAGKYSEDPGSANKGGGLGWFKRGDMVKEFDAVAFSMEPGQVSEPVRTQFGYHLIKVLEKDDERVNAAHILVQVKVGKDALEKAKEDVAAIKEEIEAGLDFAAAAKKYSVDEQSRDNGGDLGWKAAANLPREFAGPVKQLKPGEISDPITSPYGFHLMKLIDRKDSAPLTLDGNYEMLRNMARNSMILKEVDKIVASLKEDVLIENRLEEKAE